MPEPILPLGIYFAAILAFVAFALIASHFLGERHREQATDEPFESGVRPLGTARSLIPAKYYLIAMLFVIFDLEAVFIIAWAIVAREAGWAGYVEIVIFIGILIAALAYLWRVGALEWGPKGRRKPPPPGHWTQARRIPQGKVSAGSD